MRLRAIAASDPNSALNPLLIKMAAGFDERASVLEERQLAVDLAREESAEPSRLQPFAPS